MSTGLELLSPSLLAGVPASFLLAFFGILILSLSIHEWGHAYCALRLGDDTAERLGRVTLNPLPHLDPVFSVALPLTMLFSGTGMLFGAG